MDELQATAVFPAIAPDALSEFKELAAQALASTRNEPGTLQYDLFLTDDETRCVVREKYANSEAVMTHLGNVAPLLGRLVDLGGGLELEVFGVPSAEVLAAIEPFGPRTYTYHQGK